LQVGRSTFGGSNEHDLELQPLANHHVFADLGSDAFDLLLMRMEALQLEPNE
jgi:hypothetical protein